MTNRDRAEELVRTVTGRNEQIRRELDVMFLQDNCGTAVFQQMIDAVAGELDRAEERGRIAAGKGRQ